MPPLNIIFNVSCPQYGAVTCSGCSLAFTQSMLAHAPAPVIPVYVETGWMRCSYIFIFVFLCCLNHSFLRLVLRWCFPFVERLQRSFKYLHCMLCLDFTRPHGIQTKLCSHLHWMSQTELVACFTPCGIYKQTVGRGCGYIVNTKDQTTLHFWSSELLSLFLLF